MTEQECTRAEIDRRVQAAREILDSLVTMIEVAANRPFPVLRRGCRRLCDAVHRTAVVHIQRDVTCRHARPGVAPDPALQRREPLG